MQLITQAKDELLNSQIRAHDKIYKDFRAQVAAHVAGA